MPCHSQKFCRESSDEALGSFFCYNSSMGKIFIHNNNIDYVRKWEALESGKWNGGYYYSMDIENHIAPKIETDRPINVLGVKTCGGTNRMLVFIHNYLDASDYFWMRKFDDVIIVSSDYNVEKPLLDVKLRVIHLPLSVNVAEVAKHKITKKTQEECYVGNQWAFKKQELQELVPPEVHRFGEMPRERMWDTIAKYKYVYAIGLCAIESRILGCRLKMSRYRYPDPEEAFKVFDLDEAAQCLNEGLKIMERDDLDYFDCTTLDLYKKFIDGHKENHPPR